MIFRLINEVSNEIENRYKGQSNSVDFFVYRSIEIWCNKFAEFEEFNQYKDINDYILGGYSNLYEIQDLTKHLYQEWKPKEKGINLPLLDRQK